MIGDHLEGYCSNQVEYEATLQVVNGYLLRVRDFVTRDEIRNSCPEVENHVQYEHNIEEVIDTYIGLSLQARGLKGHFERQDKANPQGQNDHENVPGGAEPAILMDEEVLFLVKLCEYLI